MKSDYWYRRQAQNMVDFMQEAEETAKQVSKFYQRASTYLCMEAEDIYDRYKERYRLSDAEAKRLLNKMQDKASLDELIEKLKESGKEDETKKELIKQIEAPAYRARIERLQRLQEQIDYIMVNVYNQEVELSTAHYIDLAQEAYYHNVFEVQQRVGESFSFNYVDAKTIEQVINSKWSGENYSKRIWKNTQELAEDLKQELLVNLVTGRTNKEVQDIIQNKYHSGMTNARRLIRTESSYIVNALNAIAYRKMGIVKYQFCAILDLRTSKICREFDGKVFLVEDIVMGLNYPPMHPYCRSTTVGVISEKYLKEGTRRTRDPETHKVIDVPADMTYQEWYNKYVAGNPKAMLEEKKIKNRASDRKQWKKYREILRDNIPDSLDKFQDMKYNEAEKWEKLKIQKQDQLNALDFPDMENLRGKLGNKEVRQWYKAHDEKIPDLIDKTLPLDQQARQAFEMRNQYRTQARNLMKDQVARKELDVRHKNCTFEELLEHKRKKYGLTENEAYEDIIRSSATTNKRYDRIAGID